MHALDHVLHLVKGVAGMIIVPSGKLGGVPLQGLGGEAAARAYDASLGQTFPPLDPSIRRGGLSASSG